MPTWCWAISIARRCWAARCAIDAGGGRTRHRAAVGDPLGLSVAEAAARIVEVVNSNMAQALRIVSVERGHDPQAFSLIAFGGAGPVHAAALAEELQIPEVIIPPAPGAFSALGPGRERPEAGLLAHAIRRSRQLSIRRASPTAFAAMEAEGRACWTRRNVPPERRALLRQADVRYRRQAYELTVPIADGAITRATLEALAAAFHAKHEQTYGHANPRRTGAAGQPAADRAGAPAGADAGAAQRSGAGAVRDREVWFGGVGFVATPVHWRDGLVPGTCDRRAGDHRGDGFDHGRAAGLAARSIEAATRTIWMRERGGQRYAAFGRGRRAGSRWGRTSW